MTTAPEARSCAVCGNVVDGVSRGDETIGYRHTPSTVDDHPVVPVPTDAIETNFKCDFCGADHARWELPVEPFSIGMLGGVDHNSADGWAACDDCAVALRANDWNKVIYRARRAHDRRESMSFPQQTYAHLYRMVRDHVTGPVRLMIRSDP